jgi:hypothetical protein
MVLKLRMSASKWILILKKIFNLFILVKNNRYDEEQFNLVDKARFEINVTH